MAGVAMRPGGPEAIRREQLNRHLQTLAKRAPSSLAAHAALFHRSDDNKPILPAAHHKEWVRILEDRETFRWVVVVAPPGYAKSTWFSVAYASWRIGQEKGRLRIGLLSRTGDLAQGFGKGVADSIENARYQKVYGIRPDEKKGWNLSQMWTTGAVDKVNPNLHCVGIGGNVQGHRYDEIILDDPSTWEDVRSTGVMDGQRFFVKTTLLERFPPGLKPPDGLGRMVVVLTRWGDNDLVEMFRELGFVIITMPALGYWDRRAVCSICGSDRDPDLYAVLQRCEHCDTPERPENIWGQKPLWEEREPFSTLELQREDDPILFDLVKQGDPKAVAGNVFDVRMFNTGILPDRNQFERVVQYVDTAGGKDRKKGDYFVIVTIGLRKGGQEIWVLDVFRDRIPAPEQEQKVIDKGRDPMLRPDRIYIESKNEGIALYQRLIISRDARLPLEQVTPVADKEFRAIPWANVVNAGRVWIPANHEGVPVSWARNFTIEHAGFPGGRHDDQVDAAAGAYGQTTQAGPRVRVLRAGAV